MKFNFTEDVYTIVRMIPKGKIMTYKEVATMAGRPNAFRAVGTILSRNSDKKTPCHRVIRSDGKIGGYNTINGPSKRELLLKEGIKI